MERITSMVRDYLKGFIHGDDEIKRSDELLNMNINGIKGEMLFEQLLILNNVDYKREHTIYNSDYEFTRTKEFYFVKWEILSKLEEIYFSKMDILQQMNTPYVFRVLRLKDGNFGLKYMYEDYKVIVNKNSSINMDDVVFINNIIKIIEKYTSYLTSKDIQNIFYFFNTLNVDKITFLTLLPDFLEMRNLSLYENMIGIDLFEIMYKNLHNKYNVMEIYNIYRNTKDSTYVNVDTYINNIILRERKNVLYKKGKITNKEVELINILEDNLKNVLMNTINEYIELGHKIIRLNDNEYIINKLLFVDTINKKVENYISNELKFKMGIKNWKNKRGEYYVKRQNERNYWYNEQIV